MTRPIRIEFSVAFYHVTSRGDCCENIYEDDEDRVQFLDVLKRVVGILTGFVIPTPFLLKKRTTLNNTNPLLARATGF